MDYIRLGQRIRDERLKLGLTQSKLAEEVDISDAYMGHIERGERSLTLNTLIRLVNRLHVSVDYLLQDYIEDTDENIVNQFKQIIDSQTLADKQMAIDILKTMFTHINNRS
jgi:transcriptional regulator with XRE-family HTH domain